MEKSRTLVATAAGALFVLDRALPAGWGEATVTSHHQQVRNGVELVQLGGSPLRVGVLSI